jgi:hypothetical protein
VSTLTLITSTYLGNHGHESLTLAGGNTNEHTRSQVPVKVCCERAQNGTDDHDGGRSEKDNAPADGDCQWHADQVANAPRQYELKCTEGQ